MGKVNVQKRGKVYQYQFEIAPVGGKRKFQNKSGFRTRAEAEREGIKAYNEYMQTGVAFKPSEISYSDYLDYWMKEYCIRIPYSELFIYVPKESVCWISYDNRALIYLIDDKEYILNDKYNKEQERVNKEDVESISQSEKQKVNEYYKSYQV